MTNESSLTVAGVKVPKQQIALATSGVWSGDGTTSGILGLGLPGLTEAFRGDDPAKDGEGNLVQYKPVMSSLASLGSPGFSLALSRYGGSFFGIGGVALGVETSGPWASTPILKV